MSNEDQKNLRLLVVDNETPWVRSLFLATPPEVHVDFLGLLNLRERKFKPHFTLSGMFRATRLSHSHTERYVWSFTRLRFLTRLWLNTYLHWMNRHESPYDAVIVTSPLAAHYISVFRRSSLIYYAYDPFEHYTHLRRHPVRELENYLLRECDLIVAISRTLSADFRSRTSKSVMYSPNAADKIRPNPTSSKRSEFENKAFIIGCVGQINASYDWSLIDDITSRLVDVGFVFIGPVLESDVNTKDRIEVIFNRDNVRWLGPRPHHEIPEYVESFDVCFCPLAVTPHNDRRSPLRLYDYLMTDKPVISTGIAEAKEHLPHILLADDFEQFRVAIQLIRTGAYRVDLAARTLYMQKQTWSVRASALIQETCRLKEGRLRTISQ